MGLSVRHYPGIERLSPEFLHQLAAEADARGWDLDDLLGHMWVESAHFKTDAANPYSSARGLIQMLDETARLFAGVSSAQLARMTDVEQLPGIVRYYDVGLPLEGAAFRLLGYSRPGTPEKVAYLLSAPDSYQLYGSSEAAINPGADAGGSITAGSVRDEWRRLVEGPREGFGWIEVPEPGQRWPGARPDAPASPVVWALVALGLAAIVKSGSRWGLAWR